MKKKSKKRILIIFLATFIIVSVASFFIIVLSSKPTITINQIYTDETGNSLDVDIQSPNLFNKHLYICIDNNPLADENTLWEEYNPNSLYQLSKGNNYIHCKDDRGHLVTYEDHKLIKFNLLSELKYPFYPIDDEIKLDYDYVSIGDSGLQITSSNNDVAYTNQDVIYTKAKGQTTITLSCEETNLSLDLIVTDLYTLEDIDSASKPFLKETICNDQENKMLDEVLRIKITDAGYKTRAGVVEAARFLSLQFPYKLAYFSESGRLDTTLGDNYSDGEGRYYHRGLFLSESKFADLRASIFGPAYWGQFFEEDDSDDHSLDDFYLYDGFVPSEIRTHKYLSKRPNGLDCSGFVSWCYYNGGFDLGDMGAGGPNVYGMSKLGEFVYINDDLLKSDRIKAGDLVGYPGHVGIVIGVEDDYIWIADTLITGTKVTKYERNKADFDKLEEDAWRYFMLMDGEYKEDGNYTAMWN